MSQEPPDERGLVRVSDAERHEVAELLREAAGEGRLDLEELDERLAAAYAARTRADLVPLVADLPAAGAAAVPAVPGDGPPSRLLAVMGGLSRRGRWEVPARLEVTVVMGGAELDLREAAFAVTDVTVRVVAVMGGASVVVGPDTDVVVDGTGVMGGFSGPSGLVRATPGTPVRRVRVTGVAIWGGVSVERKVAGRDG